MIADRIHHCCGLLAIATPETLAAPTFNAKMRDRLRAIAADVEALERQAQAGTSEAGA